MYIEHVIDEGIEEIKRRGIGLQVGRDVLKSIANIGVLRSVMYILESIYRSLDDMCKPGSSAITVYASTSLVLSIFTTMCGMETDVGKIMYAVAELMTTPKCEYKKYILEYMKTINEKINELVSRIGNYHVCDAQ